jgi:hypothetical protein
VRFTVGPGVEHDAWTPLAGVATSEGSRSAFRRTSAPRRWRRKLRANRTWSS